MELARAAPEVIARRTARMAAAGAMPNPRDAAEFIRMFTEKTAAFSQAWIAGWAAVFWAPWHVAMDLQRVGVWFGGHSSARDRLTRAWHRQGWSIAGSWLAPVHRTAVANARRLRRS